MDSAASTAREIAGTEKRRVAKDGDPDTLHVKIATTDEAGDKQHDAFNSAPQADTEARANSPFQKAPGKVYGRTPDGTVFVVPETHDMVRNLLDPRLKKSIAEVTTVAVLISYILLWMALPQSWRIPVFLLMFAFWRAAYNGGIGWLLQQQSHHKQLTVWAKEYRVFEKSEWWVHKLIHKDLTVKFADNYDFYKMPLEYNTWLLFRNLVDLILMSDFTCYMLLACACFHHTEHSWHIVLGRWVAGIGLFLFNLWVKLDAHRVVKDYAWYWGDFFFLEDVNLTFDGVFEMAPHPMYSIGYAGYYGICLITASYTLFAASVLAHAAQFAFLIAVENPHIEKTYNPEATKPRKQSRSLPDVTGPDVLLSDHDSEVSPLPAMLVLSEFNITRSSDILLVLLALNSSLLYFAPPTRFWYVVTFVYAVAWRLFHFAGLGYVLRRQSESKWWTKIFLKFGGTSLDAYRQWQAIYNASTVMSYVSLGVFALRVWSSPFNVSFWPFWYIVGVMLILLQCWTSYSIYESLGEYGWFFGDFFYTRPAHRLTYSGIYRYLNNPERLFGIAGVWGLSLLTNSISVTTLALLWTFGNMAFIQFVEQPHMKKLYGDKIRREAGVVKTIRQAAKLAPPLESRVKQLQGSFDKVIGETATAVETFLNQAKPKFEGGVKGVVEETKVLLRQYPARMTIVRVAEDINVDTSLYSLEIMTEPQAREDKRSLVFDYGTPLVVKWTADENHSKKDWIGLYRITDNVSREVTKVSSSGRWSAIDPTGYRDHNDSAIKYDSTTGEVRFAGNRLFWEKGVYEFRYHHGGKHNVLAISPPFEIDIQKQEIGADANELAASILALIRVSCDGTLQVPPDSITDLYDLHDNTVLQRVTYGIQTIYGVELAPAVVRSDRNALSLASRLISVKSALQPFIQKSDAY